MASSCGPLKLAPLVLVLSNSPTRAPLEFNSVTLPLVSLPPVSFTTQALPEASMATPYGKLKLEPVGS